MNFWKISANRILCEKKGSSIVSVMAAFVILLIGLSMVTTATLSAQRASVRSAQVRRQTEKCMEAYYLDKTGDGIKKESASTSFTLTDGTNTVKIPGSLGEFSYEYENIDEKSEKFVLYFFENKS